MPVIPATLEAEIRKIAVLGQPSKKLARFYLKKQAGCGSAFL
jgi:hypothetical protein